MDKFLYCPSSGGWHQTLEPKNLILQRRVEGQVVQGMKIDGRKKLGDDQGWMRWIKVGWESLVEKKS
jgi:hypothetical protein